MGRRLRELFLCWKGFFEERKMVPMEGVEPTRPCGHQILSLARLPIPPHRHSKSAGGKSNQGWRGMARGFGNGISR